MDGGNNAEYFHLKSQDRSYYLCVDVAGDSHLKVVMESLDMPGQYWEGAFNPECMLSR